MKILSNNSKQKSSHDICSSAKHNAEQFIVSMLEFYNSNIDKINSFAKDYNTHYPNYNSGDFTGYYETNKIYKDYDTTAVETGIKEELVEKLKQEIKKTYKLQTQISNIVEKLNFKKFIYNPFSLQFENAILFTPSGVEFYKLMNKTVYEYFPEVKGIQFEAFIVKAGTKALGVHNARPSSLHYKIPFEEGILIPEKHMSFWIALTETSREKQPLMIFEDSESESPSMAYMYNLIKQNKILYSDIELKTIDTAFYRFTYNLSTLDDKIFASLYMYTMYLQSKYCHSSEKVYGYNWDLNPGQGIIFNNFKAHGDSSLPESTTDRITVALRCFSKTKTYESVFGRLPTKAQNIVDSNELQKECLLKIFGYKDKKDFLKTIYGEDYSDELVKMPIAALLTDVALGYSGMYKSSERMDILTIPEGLIRHYERNKEFFQSEEYSLNNDAIKCIEDYYMNSKGIDNTYWYFDGYTISDVFSYINYKIGEFLGGNNNVFDQDEF